MSEKVITKIEDVFENFQYNANNISFELKNSTLQLYIYDIEKNKHTITFEYDSETKSIILLNGIFKLDQNYKINCIQNSFSNNDKFFKLNTNSENNYNISFELKNCLISIPIFSFNFSVEAFSNSGVSIEVFKDNKYIQLLQYKLNKIFYQISKEF